MQSSAENTIIATFALFEQLSEAVSGWDLDFRQLTASSGDFLLEQAVGPNMLYSRAAFDSHFHQRGGTPAGFRTFSLLARRSSRIRWCGEAINHGALMIMPRDGEFESFSSPGFDIYNLSLSQQLLEKVAAERFGRLLQEMLPDGRLLCQHSGEPLTRLRSLLQLISIKLQEGKAMGAAHADFTIDSLMEEAAAFLALSCLTQGTSKSPPRPGAKKMQILDNVFSSLETTSAAGASVPALAAIAGVCRRSLENAFDDVLGVSPATYLKAMRLRHLHKDLLSGGPDYASVSGLMARHGFRHGGRAAGDYRAMFGESPRETLQRPG